MRNRPSDTVWTDGRTDGRRDTEVKRDGGRENQKGEREWGRQREGEREGWRQGGRKGGREYYHIRSCGIVELLNTVQIGLRITLVSKTERERPQLIH